MPRKKKADKPRERATTPAVLSVVGVSRSFGGLRALDDVSVEVREGEIVGLIGPNGAGKSTLMECISGFQPADTGRVLYRGQDLLGSSPWQRAELGIGRTLQNVRLFPFLTVVDNVRVALHRHTNGSAWQHALRLPSARVEERRILREAERIIDLVGMNEFAEKFASELSYGTLRLLELACVLALRPNLLLLDEPASGISQKETEALGPLLRSIKSQTGATILMIEHDMPLIMSLADHIYCLDAGQVLADGTPDQIQADELVIEAYLGTPNERQQLAKAATRDTTKDIQPLLQVEAIDVWYDKVQVLEGVDFEVRPHEMVALLGTNGAGKSTVLRAASGLVPVAQGRILWKGHDVTGMPAEQLVRTGLGHVPGGRGVFPTLTVHENLRMGGFLLEDSSTLDREIERVTSYFPWLRERLDQSAGTLSGGEQQQLAIARALINEPEVLLVDEMSLGLAPIVIEQLMEVVLRLHDDAQVAIVIVEQQATFALGYTDRAYFLEKGTVRYEGPSAGLLERDDLLRSVFLEGAAEGFAAAAR